MSEIAFKACGVRSAELGGSVVRQVYQHFLIAALKGGYCIFTAGFKAVKTAAGIKTAAFERTASTLWRLAG